LERERIQDRCSRLTRRHCRWCKGRGRR
jgi:hypothetical protein